MPTGRGIIKMRILGIVALCAAPGGCAASRQEVATRLGDQYVGQNVDALQRICVSSEFNLKSTKLRRIGSLINLSTS